MSSSKILLICLFLVIILSLPLLTEFLRSRQPTIKKTLNQPSSSPLTDGKIYTVKRVIDGDTIELNDGTRVRYLGIDAPEIAHVTEARIKNQELRAEEEDCFGQEAKRINEGLVLGKKVRLGFDGNKYDRYGRILAWVFIQKGVPLEGDPFQGDPLINPAGAVNFELVKNGAAYYYWSPIPIHFSQDLTQAQEDARKERAGIWGKCGKINGQCLVKGNLDRNDRRYYHLPGFKYYQATEVNPEHGDRWFCSEEDAVKAGFKRAVD